MGLGRGNNNYVELLTAKYLIHFALNKQCMNLQLFGASKLVCNWINKKCYCNEYSLRHILDETHRLILTFDSFVFHHIYREHNSTVDHLSKEAVHKDDGTWLIYEKKDGVTYQHYHRSFIDPEAELKAHPELGSLFCLYVNIYVYFYMSSQNCATLYSLCVETIMFFSF